jgi:hypothetical protein
MQNSAGSAGHPHMTASTKWADEMRDYVGQRHCVTHWVSAVAHAACIPSTNSFKMKDPYRPGVIRMCA